MTDCMLIKCDNDEPGSLPACVEPCLGRHASLLLPLYPLLLPPPAGFQGIAPLTSSPATEKTEIIDQSHQGDSGLDSSSGTAGGSTAAHVCEPSS